MLSCCISSFKYSLDNKPDELCLLLHAQTLGHQLKTFLSSLIVIFPNIPQLLCAHMHYICVESPHEWDLSLGERGLGQDRPHGTQREAIQGAKGAADF